MDYSLEIYKDKAGKYRWTFYVDGDKQIASTDGRDTMEQAYKHARDFLCKPWMIDDNVENDGGVASVDEEEENG